MTKAQKLAQANLEAQSTSPVEQVSEVQIEVQEAKPIDREISEVDEMYIPLKKAIKKVHTVKTGVGYDILMLIAQGELSNKEIVDMVLAANPLRKTTYACVAWYKSQVKAGKIDLPVLDNEDDSETVGGDGFSEEE